MAGISAFPMGGSACQHLNKTNRQDEQLTDTMSTRVPRSKYVPTSRSSTAWVSIHAVRTSAVSVAGIVTVMELGAVRRQRDLRVLRLVGRREPSDAHRIRVRLDPSVRRVLNLLT